MAAVKLVKMAAVNFLRFTNILFVFSFHQHDGSSASQSTGNDSALNTRIVGGYSVTDGSRFPYFVQMWGIELCGGALIAPDVVISAAHVSFAEAGRRPY